MYIDPILYVRKSSELRLLRHGIGQKLTSQATEEDGVVWVEKDLASGSLYDELVPSSNIGFHCRANEDVGSSLPGSIGGHHSFGPPGIGAGSKGRDSRG